MAASKDERNRILQLIELQQITADQAAELLDAMGEEPVRVVEPPRVHTIRLRATTLKAGVPQAHVIANLPVSLLRTSFRLGAHMFPQVSQGTLEEMLRAIERGNTGRLLDVQDLEKGERLEIFVE